MHCMSMHISSCMIYYIAYSNISGTINKSWPKWLMPVTSH